MNQMHVKMLLYTDGITKRRNALQNRLVGLNDTCIKSADFGNPYARKRGLLMNDKIEEMLIAQMKRGDRHAFAQIYEKYRPSVFRTACLISGNTQDGEDITQETFVKVFMHCTELKSDALFRYWLFKILNRTSWTFLNRKKAEVPDESILDKADTNQNPLTEDIFLKKEQQNEIYQAVMQLDYKLRLVVILYYYNELSTKQIAKIADCCEGTVKSRLFTARKRLRQLIPEERYDAYCQGNYHEKQSI